ncbi:hypothetical protein LCGC14_1025790 [marine sediment metagenome]|uniref:Uncharacterized protein n=1 Tax=marine sediment metagenome TaxID=412755 RepID=A0A0F9QE34_9ZZZZ
MAKYEVPVPNRVRVAASPATVSWGGKADEELLEKEFHGMYGGNRAGGRRIILDSHQNDSQFSGTFLHELLEYISAIHTGQRISHRTIVTFAVGLHQVFEGMGLRFVKGDTTAKEAKQ